MESLESVASGASGLFNTISSTIQSQMEEIEKEKEQVRRRTAEHTRRTVQPSAPAAAPITSPDAPLPGSHAPGQTLPPGLDWEDDGSDPWDPAPTPPRRTLGGPAPSNLRLPATASAAPQPLADVRPPSSAQPGPRIRPTALPSTPPEAAAQSAVASTPAPAAPSTAPPGPAADLTAAVRSLVSAPTEGADQLVATLRDAWAAREKELTAARRQCDDLRGDLERRDQDVRHAEEEMLALGTAASDAEGRAARAESLVDEARAEHVAEMATVNNRMLERIHSLTAQLEDAVKARVEAEAQVLHAQLPAARERTGGDSGGEDLAQRVVQLEADLARAEATLAAVAPEAPTLPTANGWAPATAPGPAPATSAPAAATEVSVRVAELEAALVSAAEESSRAVAQARAEAEELRRAERCAVEEERRTREAAHAEELERLRSDVAAARATEAPASQPFSPYLRNLFISYMGLSAGDDTHESLFNALAAAMDLSDDERAAIEAGRQKRTAAAQVKDLANSTISAVIGFATEAPSEENLRHHLRRLEIELASTARRCEGLAAARAEALGEAERYRSLYHSLRSQASTRSDNVASDIFTALTGGSADGSIKDLEARLARVRRLTPARCSWRCPDRPPLCARAADDGGAEQGPGALRVRTSPRRAVRRARRRRLPRPPARCCGACLVPGPQRRGEGAAHRRRRGGGYRPRHRAPSQVLLGRRHPDVAPVRSQPCSPRPRAPAHRCAREPGRWWAHGRAPARFISMGFPGAAGATSRRWGAHVRPTAFEQGSGDVERIVEGLGGSACVGWHAPQAYTLRPGERAIRESL